MKTYTFQIFRNGEYVESVGIVANNIDNARVLLRRAGYLQNDEEERLVSTS